MAASIGCKIHRICSSSRLLIKQSKLLVASPINQKPLHGIEKKFSTLCISKVTELHGYKPTVIQPSPRFTQSVRCRQFTTLSNINQKPQTSLLSHNENHQQTPKRSKTRYSLGKGKPKTVKSIVGRFRHLDWGAWIRTRAGKHKKLWRKPEGRKYRLRQHVFCTKGQSKKLNHMVTDYWKKPRHYFEDPYAPYNKRTNFSSVSTNEKPPFLP